MSARRTASGGALLVAALVGCAAMEEVAKVGGDMATQVGYGQQTQQALAAVHAGGLVLRSFADINPDQEYYIGRSVCAEVLANPSFTVSKNQAVQDYVANVGQAIALGAPSIAAPYQGYRFTVLDSKTVNAFAAPAGYVFITSGAVAATRDEEQLAGILAHEIAHVQLKHGLKAIKQSNLVEAGKIIGGEATKQSSVRLVAVFGDSVRDVVGTVVTNGFSREQETEADKVAVTLLREAGYSPQGLVDFLGRVNFDGGGFRSDHPSAADRVAALTPLVGSQPGSPRGVERRTTRHRQAIPGAA